MCGTFFCNFTQFYAGPAGFSIRSSVHDIANCAQRFNNCFRLYTKRGYNPSISGIAFGGGERKKKGRQRKSSLFCQKWYS